jgi:hypothetical protein
MMSQMTEKDKMLQEILKVRFTTAVKDVLDGKLSTKVAARQYGLDWNEVFVEIKRFRGSGKQAHEYDAQAISETAYRSKLILERNFDAEILTSAQTSQATTSNVSNDYEPRLDFDQASWFN